MRIHEWEARYRSGERAEDRSTAPTPLVVDTVAKLSPGSALDIASGTGRNAVWLAEHGWKVTAVDGAQTAIDALRERAQAQRLDIEAQTADLEAADFEIEPDSWALILKCYYLQRSLFPAVRAGLRPGGIAIVIVHLVKPEEELTYKHAAPEELRSFFEDWEILHYFEGQPNDPAHKRVVAELVARKPGPTESTYRS